MKDTLEIMEMMEYIDEKFSERKQLIEVIKLVAEKYKNTVNLIISGDILALEYLYYRDGKQDLYKTIQITEFEERLSIKLFPEKVTKIINIDELENIFLILQKQSQVQKHSEEEIQFIKATYQKGKKVRLIKMYDLQAPKSGTKGIVDFVDDIRTIHIKWEDGSSLGLIVGKDEFEVLEEKTEVDTENSGII